MPRELPSWLERASVPPALSVGDTPPFFCLPLELHLMICETLNSSEDTSSQPLRLSHPYFYHNTPRPRFINSAALLCLERSRYSRKKSLYACGECRRLRHISKFGLDWPGNIEPIQKEKLRRFCADCGFRNANTATTIGELPYWRKPLYPLGTTVWVGGVRWLWCFRCNKVKKGANELLDTSSDGSWDVCKKYHLAEKQQRLFDMEWFGNF